MVENCGDGFSCAYSNDPFQNVCGCSTESLHPHVQDNYPWGFCMLCGRFRLFPSFQGQAGLTIEIEYLQRESPVGRRQICFLSRLGSIKTPSETKADGSLLCKMGFYHLSVIYLGNEPVYTQHLPDGVRPFSQRWELGQEEVLWASSSCHGFYKFFYCVHNSENW